MAEERKSLHLTISLPESRLYDADVEGIVATAVDGKLGILSGHAPLLTLLAPGPLRADTPDGLRRFNLGPGLLRVDRNQITVVVEGVQPAERAGSSPSTP